MDSFFEQLVTRRLRPVESVMRVLILAAAALAIALATLAAMLRIFGAASFLCIPLSFGVGYAAWHFVSNMNVEFEYAVTNGVLDIDKIIAKRKRKRLISADCRDFEDFGEYDTHREQLAERQFNFRVTAANLQEAGLVYAVTRHDRLGVGLLILQPDERILAAMRRFVKVR